MKLATIFLMLRGRLTESSNILLTATILYFFSPLSIAAPPVEWQAKCQVCHGETGEGLPGLAPIIDPDKFTIPELIQYIDFTMPIAQPHTCTDSCAENMAIYIKSWGNELAEGKDLYDDLCVVCHGTTPGQGPFPLDPNNISLNEMIAYIDALMPIQMPESCEGPCADKTALYIKGNEISEPPPEPPATCSIKLRSKRNGINIANVTIKNTSQEVINGWDVDLKYSSSATLSGVRAAKVKQKTATGFTAINTNRNKIIEPGANAKFRFKLKPDNRQKLKVSVSGDICK